MEITGNLVSVFEQNEYAAGKFLQKFRIETGGEYSQLLEFSCFNKKIDKIIPKLRNNEGSDIKVDFNISTNLYNDKIYTNLNAFDAEIVRENSLDETETKQESEVKPDPDPDLDDDIPF